MEHDSKNFKDTLTSLYGKNSEKLDRDFNYLWDAFQHTEELWWENIREIGQVKYILIAEAPLYGEKRSYIYNPDFGRTPFLEFTHINFLSQKLGLKGIVSNKKDMLQNMREMGLVVLDLFPFAFNNDTTYQFGRLSEKLRTSLAHSCSSWFLQPKLREILNNCKEAPTFGVRYKRLFSFANDLITSSVPSGVSPSVVLACKRVANAPLDLDELYKNLR